MHLNLRARRTNFVTGLYTAKADSIPVLAITGQHDQLGKESFQAVDIAEIVRPIVKRTYHVSDPVMVPWVFREAFKTMKEARPGPVLIDLPISVQKGLISFDEKMNPPLPLFPIPPFPRQIRTAVDMILSAEKPAMLLGGGGAGTLGWDVPASIGAKVARPEKLVVCIVGDYGFQFCMQELTAAVMYDVPFLCIVLNNGYLGLIRQNAEFQYDMDYETAIWYEHEGNEGRGFDFVKFAEACGARGERVTDPKDLAGAFQRGIASGGPYVVDVILERNTWCAMGPAIDSACECPDSK